jgi:predicted alpha-1,6-mannanase (GH76 family)
MKCALGQAFEFSSRHSNFWNTPTNSRGKIMLCKVPSDYTEKIIAGLLVF